MQKPDPAALKELCIVTLTKIYWMTHRYQTLLREITTPTLPTFVTSCLNLVSQKKAVGPTSLEEGVFQSFAMLVPRHTTVFRPFASQIRSAVRPYLAPTLSDQFFVSSSLRNSARALAVILHQTAAKNTGGEEWGKAVRELIKDIHATSDLVFRAVVEDWESIAGYIGEAIDVNQELQGDGVGDALPLWTGIHAGVERLTGRLELLAEYFRMETAAPVAISLGLIMDMVTRMLSIPIPMSESSTSNRGARLHPAIDRDEKDGLWAGMPQVYVAALQLVDALAVRLEDNFLPLALESYDQLAWVFEYGKHSPEFRLMAYNVTAKTLSHIGQSLNQIQCGKVAAIVQACCTDLQETYMHEEGNAPNGMVQKENNADAFLRSKINTPVELGTKDTELSTAGSALLPVLLSHLPQHYLGLSLRSLIDRTAILTHNKDAMVASILNPFVGKNGAALASILPHLTRSFGHDATVELLLRPRMPTVPATGVRAITENAVGLEEEDEEMNYQVDSTTQRDVATLPTATASIAASAPGLNTAAPVQPLMHQSTFGTSNTLLSVPTMNSNVMGATAARDRPSNEPVDVPMAEDDDSSDNESVHLTMHLDTDSEDED